MEPIKLEEHIREQLEEREIAPSALAWDKLEAKLDKAENTKRPLFIWYGIAASIVGMALIASQFFFSEKVQVNTQLVEVETESSTIEKTNSSEILKTETQLAKTPKEISENVVTSVINTKQKANEVANNKRLIKKVKEPKKVMPVVKDTRVAEQQNINASVQEISEDINQDAIFNSKVDEVVVAIQQLKQDKNAITVAEIDNLLLNAQRDLAAKRILNETKIDATALLNDVEFELEKTFRDKVFDALGDSFSKIRTAVVERNN